jgi:hypothetical protein
MTSFDSKRPVYLIQYLLSTLSKNKVSVARIFRASCTKKWAAREGRCNKRLLGVDSHIRAVHFYMYALCRLSTQKERALRVKRPVRLHQRRTY